MQGLILTENPRLVYSTPSIYFSLSTLMELGIRDIMFATTKENYCIDLLGTGNQFGCKFTYRYCKAHPLWCFKDQIKDKIIVIRSDNIFYGPSFYQFLKDNAIVDGATIFTHHKTNPSDIVGIEDNKIIGVWESPKSQGIVWRGIGVPGIYLYDKSILETCRGKTQITHLNRALASMERLKVIPFEDDVVWFEVKNPDELLEAGFFFRTLITRGIIIADPIATAHKMGFISTSQATGMRKCH